MVAVPVTGNDTGRVEIRMTPGRRTKPFVIVSMVVLGTLITIRQIYSSTRVFLPAPLSQSSLFQTSPL